MWQPTNSASRAAIERNWDPQIGDLRQELVLIGLGLERRALSCDAELALREEGWLEFSAPLPAWPRAVLEGGGAL